MLGGLVNSSDGQDIVIYDILSGTRISSHSLQGPGVIKIWTHGECLQFSTIELGSIIIWEVGFTSTNAPTQVASLPVPFNFPLVNPVFLPTLSWLGFIHQGRIIVWDVQHQKILLDSIDVKDPGGASFSTGGHFFMCRTGVQKFCFWKKSPDGYLPYQNPLPSTSEAIIIPPNGESIISFGSSQLQLWHTNSPTTSPQHSQHTEHFLVELSPDGSLVAITEQFGNMVEILDVKSGNLQLDIDTDMEICGIRITESSVIAVSVAEAVTWELCEGDCVLNVQTTFNLPQITTPLASISPDLNYVAFTESMENLYICSMDTGEQLAIIRSDGWLSGFTLDGIGVWCAGSYYQSTKSYVDQWAIIRDDESDIIELEYTETARDHPLSGFPWYSSYGYQVTDDGWVLSSSGKPLLWLPHQWQSQELERKWSGNFLALSHKGLPEAIILELEV